MVVELGHHDAHAAHLVLVAPFSRDFADNLPGLLHTFLAPRHVFSSHALQVIDVVEVDILDFTGRSFDVTRHSNINQQRRAPPADLHGTADCSRVHDCMRGAGGADDNVRLRQVIFQQIKRDGLATMALGQGLAMLQRAVEHQDIAGAAFDKALERQLRHFARADDHDCLGAEVREDLLGKLHGHGADGDATA